MIIGQVLMPLHSLGPGERIGIWTCGCTKNCSGCISPEFHQFKGAAVDAGEFGEKITALAEKTGCTALTVSGGDPFEQADELLLFLRTVRDSFGDILIYTGYRLDEIISGKAGESAIKCLKYADVIIDGRYEDELNTPDCTLRGSSNQVIHFLNSDLKVCYEEYMADGRVVENFVMDGRTIVTGIMNRVDE